MSNSRLTNSLIALKKKFNFRDTKTVGYKGPDRRDVYLNPLLTPPPRSPTSPQDFRHPQRLGHWQPYGTDYTDPVADKYYYHETCFGLIFVGFWSMYFWLHGPDYKLVDWAKREAYLRTHKREALGLPLIDRNVVDPERIVLPTEEELGDFSVKF